MQKDVIVGDLTVSFSEMQVYAKIHDADVPLKLPPALVDLMCLFASNPNKVLTQEEMLAKLESKGTVKILQVYISQLRSVFKSKCPGAQQYLKTIYAVVPRRRGRPPIQGYMFVPPGLPVHITPKAQQAA